ncbi:MAG TPA: phosphoribosylformylglycinamidine synthase subunit PurL [Candidatus Nitrosocosmicus sp.]|nr:phosphoribosylformylglycinamidine synthase subunit PurL [Candidatus Nitrosocosmicus sp.]
MLENNPIEQAIIDAMSSEHTSYKSSKKYLKNLPTKAHHVIQGPGENAGLIDLGGEWALAMRIESHNHPSFIKPYHGAATGVGGILRDIFTMGARPIGTLDLLRFGTDVKAKQLLPEVVRGIADYGNCIGVPVVGGDIYFDATYNHNCLVNVAAFGIVKKKNIIYGHALTPGNDLIYVGARTGRDGVGGAQMASENLESMEGSTVQEDDPFLEKLLLDACCELAETGWIEGMQDMGAAGLLCSTTEVILRGRKRTNKNLGSKVYLNKVPVKAKGMTPIELLLSESQERMLIVGKKKNRSKILKLFKHWDLEAHVIGTVTDDGHYTIVYDEKKKKDISLKMDFEKIMPELDQDWPLNKWKTQHSSQHQATAEQQKKVWQQYDWMVGTRTIKGPNEKGNYAILDIHELNKELIISWSSDEGLSNDNPKKGIQHAFDRCLKNMENLKAKPLAITNCLNFGHPQDSMGAFVETLEALSERCKKKKIPIISGNVSLYNAHRNHSIKPTPMLVMVGLRNRKATQASYSIS